MQKDEVMVNISARHVHLSREHLAILFGKDYELTKLKDLYQPGEFASQEEVILEANGKQIARVRILGPIRKYTQVEISKLDSRTLKLNPPVRTSGDLANSSPITIIGPKGIVELSEGCIIANRHIHLSTEEARERDLANEQIVAVEIITEKGAILKQVHCKVKETYKLEMHIDTDDANALLMNNGYIGKMIK